MGIDSQLALHTVRVVGAVQAMMPPVVAFSGVSVALTRAIVGQVDATADQQRAPRALFHSLSSNGTKKNSLGPLPVDLVRHLARMGSQSSSQLLSRYHAGQSEFLQLLQLSC